MTIQDLSALMPLLILAAGALTVLLLGAVLPGRIGIAIGVCATLGGALWALQGPSLPASAALGIALTPFARFFTALFSLTAAATLLIAHDHSDRHGVRGEEYPATILFATFGMVTLAAATNLLILFLGLEALTFAFYILVAIDLQRASSGEAGLKYLLLGAVSAAFIAFGIALLYAATGTLEIVPAMRAAAIGGSVNSLAVAGWGLLLTGIAFKISLVPAHLWTPDVYQGGPAPVIAFLSTGSKGGAVAFLLLLLTAGGVPEFIRLPLWWLALLSMLAGNLAALLQPNLRRMLGYSSIAQMGYVALALLSGGNGGFQAAAFYAVAYTAMNLAAFGALASLEADGEPQLIEHLRGAGFSRPFAGGILAIAMFALAGIPPTAGFTGKFFIFSAALKDGAISLAVIGILSAAVSVYYYLRVVVNLYMRPEIEPVETRRLTVTESVPLIAAAMVLLWLGVFPGELLRLIDAALKP